MDDDSFDKSNFYEDFYSGISNSNFDNADSFYYDGDLAKLHQPWVMETYYIPMVIVYGLVGVVGIIGNGLVIFMLVRRSDRKNSTTMCLASLATADVAFLALNIPYETSHYFITNWQLGTVLCKVSGFVQIMAAAITVLHLTVISLERFVAIVYPMRARYLCTMGIMRWRILLIWVLAAILACPKLFILSTEMSVFYNNQSSVNVIFCSEYAVSYPYNIGIAAYQLVILFAIPAAVMVLCYVCICRVLWSSLKELRDMAPYNRKCHAPLLSRIETVSLKAKSPSTPRLLNGAIQQHKSKVLERRKQIIKLLLMIIIAFFLCWGPKLILDILQRLQLPILYNKEAYSIKVFINCLPYIQSCLNPIFYCLMSRNIRRQIWAFCMRKPRHVGKDVNIELQTFKRTSDEITSVTPAPL